MARSGETAAFRLWLLGRSQRVQLDNSGTLKRLQKF